MDEAGEDIVRPVSAVFDALSRGDIDEAASHLDDDVVIDLTRSRAPYRGLYRGRAAVREAWRDALEVWEAIEWHVELFEQLGPDLFVFESRPQARGRGSGIEAPRARGGWAFRIKDGKTVEGALFQSPEDAVAFLAESKGVLVDRI
jgi:ketosteroid isomerase-like protein